MAAALAAYLTGPGERVSALRVYSAKHPASSKTGQPVATMEEPLSLRQSYLKTVSYLMPAGALGVSLALGAAAPAAASEEPQGAQPAAVEKAKVSERLAAVRDAVSTLDGQRAAGAKADGQLAWGNWGWGGGGWGWPNWNNWHNWRNWGNWFRNW